MSEERTPKSFGYADCQNCKERFKKVTPKQKMCSDYCREQAKIRELNRKWVDSEPRKQDIKANDRIERARAWNREPFWVRRFKACRG